MLIDPNNIFCVVFEPPKNVPSLMANQFSDTIEEITKIRNEVAAEFAKDTEQTAEVFERGDGKHLRICSVAHLVDSLTS